MSPLRRLWRRIPGNIAQWLILAWVVGVSITVGWVVSDRLGEPARQQKATVGFCLKIRGDALIDVPRTASNLDRNRVRIAIGAYEVAGCEAFTGPLHDAGHPDGPDPDAFSPAPSQPAAPTGPGR